MAQDPKATTESAKPAIDSTKSSLDPINIKLNAQKAHQLSEEAAKKAASFKQLLEKDFGIQLKMPGSHAQNLINTITTLLAIKKRQADITSLIAQTMHFIKEALKAMKRAESKESLAAEYERWREHAGGESKSEQQLMAERQNKLAEEYHRREHALQNLRQQADVLAKERVTYESELKEITKEYDAKYGVLDEKYEQKHQDLQQDLTSKEAQLHQDYDNGIRDLIHIHIHWQEQAQQSFIENEKYISKMLYDNIQKVSNEKDTAIKDLTEARDKTLHELNRTKAESASVLASRISNPEQAENFKDNLNVITASYSQAVSPQDQMKALSASGLESVKPSDLRSLTKIITTDEKIKEIESSYQTKQSELEAAYETDVQNIQKAYAEKQKEIQSQHTLKLEALGQEDQAKRQALKEQLEADLAKAKEENIKEQEKLKEQYATEKAKLQSEEHSKIAEVGDKIANVDKKMRDIKQEIQVLVHPPTEKSKEVDKPAHEKVKEMYETDSKSKTDTIYKTPKLAPKTWPGNGG